MIIGIADSPLKSNRLVVVGLERALQANENGGTSWAWANDMRQYLNTMRPVQERRNVQLSNRTLEEWWAELAPGEKELIGVWPIECDDGVSGRRMSYWSGRGQLL